MAQLGIESVLVAGRGPAACAVIAACTRLGVKAVAVHSEAERVGPARPAGRRRGAARARRRRAESYLAVDRIVEAARRSGVAAVLPVPPALAGNARLAAAVVDGRADLGRSGRRGARAARRRRRGAGERARLPGVGDRRRAAVHRPPSPATGPPASPASPGRPDGRARSCRAAARRLADVGWRGLVTVGISPDGELAEVAAGFSLDMAVLERAHGVDAVELALRSAGRQPRRGAARRGRPRGRRRRPAAGRACRPGTPGRVTGRLPGIGPLPARDGDVELVAVSGYEPGDRLDGWYDALLATVSAGRPGHRDRGAGRFRRARRTCPTSACRTTARRCCAVLGRLAAGSTRPGSA